jgi:hypothetical protein
LDLSRAIRVFCKAETQHPIVTHDEAISLKHIFVRQAALLCSHLFTERRYASNLLHFYAFS